MCIRDRYRDEETLEPHEYYCKLPKPIEERLIIVTDPMLATGGSAIDAINQIKKHGGKKIKFMCILAAEEGLERLHKAHPDVQIYVGQLDKRLNENGYICPGPVSYTHLITVAMCVFHRQV